MRGGFNAILRIACPYATPQSLNRDGLPRSIKELEYSLTLRTLDTNAANVVVISRYQYVRLLPARVVSAYAAPTLFAIFFYHVFTARQRSSTRLVASPFVSSLSHCCSFVWECLSLGSLSSGD